MDKKDPMGKRIYFMNIYDFKDQLNRIERKLDSRLNQKWLNTKQVVAFAGHSVSTIHRAINSGKLKVYQGTGKNLFQKSDVDRWIKNGN